MVGKLVVLHCGKNESNEEHFQQLSNSSGSLLAHNYVCPQSNFNCLVGKLKMCKVMLIEHHYSSNVVLVSFFFFLDPNGLLLDLLNFSGVQRDGSLLSNGFIFPDRALVGVHLSWECGDL